MTRTVEVANALGMHARAAARFVQLASRFSARIMVSRDGRTADGKSILGILLLAASRGSLLELSAEGKDERQALVALVGLVEDSFGEGR